jgi:propionyl-CoA synthetase
MFQVNKLPKTRSGKTLRGILQQIASKEKWQIPAVAEDPKVFHDIAQLLSELEE